MIIVPTGMLPYIITFLGGYVVASAFLLRFPGVLHKKKKTVFRCRNISHRGGAAENLENTMTAFHHAVAVGADMLELDCHLTKDGQVVVAHDNDLKRIADVDLLISDCNFADLPELCEKMRVTFGQFHETVGGEDRRIPLLRDVFSAFPDTPINVDVKDNNDALILKVVNLVRQFDRQHLTVWGNRQSAIVKKLYELEPSVPLICSLNTCVRLLVLFYTGLLPFFPVKESFLEPPMFSIFLKEKIIGFRPKLRYSILLRIIDWITMSRLFINHLDRRGIQTYIWVLNEEEDFERAFSYGVAGVMTDFPTKLSNYLREKDGRTNTRPGQ